MTITGTFTGPYYWRPEVEPTQEFWLVEAFGGEYEDSFSYPISVHSTEAEAQAYIDAWERVKPPHHRDFGSFDTYFRVDGPLTNVPTFPVTGYVADVNDDLDDDEEDIDDLC